MIAMIVLTKVSGIELAAMSKSVLTEICRSVLTVMRRTLLTELCVTISDHKQRSAEHCGPSDN